MFQCNNCSLATLVMKAYDLRTFQFEAPDWLRTQQFLVMAKVPPETTSEQFRGMLQRMVEQRFHLTHHREQREMQGYELVVGKGGPKLSASSPSQPAPDPTAKRDDTKVGKDGFPDRPGVFNTPAGHKIRMNDQSMGQLAVMLTHPASRPVVDATKLRGTYDITLYWSSDTVTTETPPTPDLRNAGGDSDALRLGPSLTSALQSQLGLKLEPKKLLIDVFVIDHIEKTPTEN
jgi:uncharacterized protein (TIGR03435 family)